MFSRRALAVAVLSVVALTGCPGRLERPERFGLLSADGGGMPPADGGTAAPTGPEILAMRCAGSGCHGATSPAIGLDLESPGLAERVVGAPAVACMGQTLVVAVGADGSVLVDKIANETPACGTRMPLLRDALPASETAIIRAWIEGL